MTKYVPYYRVSTQRQGKSGLGLEAQKQAVKQFTKNCKDCILKEFTEVQTGKDNNRAELAKAIQYAKDNNAQLLIAKLDRLSRNAAFIFQLKDSQVNFVCCDMPDANTLTIGIFATLAQYERELISKRTKAALARLKAKGKKLGTPENLTSAARTKAIEVLRAKALNNKNNKKAINYISMLRANSLTFQQIADRLNADGFKTARGSNFFATTVKRLFDRKIKTDGTQV